MKTCPICGKSFQSPPSNPTRTCSKECSVELKRQTHTGKPHPWSEEARARKRAQPIPTQLGQGSAAAMLLPGGQKGPQNREAKIWIIKDPSGREYTVVNLLDWARNNAHLFEQEPNEKSAMRISAGFKAIKRSMEGKTSRTVGSYKGWTLIDVHSKNESGECDKEVRKPEGMDPG